LEPARPRSEPDRRGQPGRAEASWRRELRPRDQHAAQRGPGARGPACWAAGRGEQRAPDNGDPRRPRTQTVSAAAVVLPGEPADSTPTWQPGKTRRLCALQRIRPASRKPWRTRVWNVRWTSPIPQRSPPRWRRCTPCWLTRDEAVERERDHSLQGLRRQRPHALVLHVRCPGVLPPRRRPVPRPSGARVGVTGRRL